MKDQGKTTEIKKSLFGKNFFLDFIIICFVTFGVLYLFGFVPDELKINSVQYPDKASFITDTKKKAKVVGELPTKIIISTIGVDASIYNPDTNDAKIVDEYLLHGAVRYHGSGLLGDGNLFIFGHSTGFKVVNNQAYKTFNGLGKLKVGDQIIVYSSTSKYVYKVSSVDMKLASEVQVDLGSKENKLTLSTCNVFGVKEDRYIVEATFVAKEKVF
ncbi:MAG: sortase [Minisyncoccia bacterium]